MSRPSPLIQLRFPVELVLLQAGVIPAVGMIAYLLAGDLAAKSALYGGLIGWVGSSYAAWRSFRQGGRGREMLAGFYQGMIGKFMLVIMGFVLVFHQVKPLVASCLFLAFAATQLMSWVYPWLSALRTR